MRYNTTGRYKPWLHLLVGLLLVGCSTGDDSLPIESEATSESDAAKSTSEETFDPTLVTVSEGQLRGYKEEAINGKEFYSFRGIPFGLPPVNDLRFQPPQPATSWEGVREAKNSADACTQLALEPIIKGGLPEIIGSEDCLYLNVFSPMTQSDDPKQLIPVMVYIHGGGYQYGSAIEYPPHLLLSQEIVLVVIQYRLNIFGFISTEDEEAPGNMGILDQTAALAWIQKNAAAFKGDPLKITIFGQSAGASSVHLQMLSHTSLGYFHRAILQSGTVLAPWAMATNHKEVAFHIAKLLNCGKEDALPPNSGVNCTEFIEYPFLYQSCLVDRMTSKEVMQCIKETPAHTLVELPRVFSTSETYLENFFISCEQTVGFLPFMMAPRVHPNLLMKDPILLVKEHRRKKVDVMIGTVKDEGAIFALQIYTNEGLRSALRFRFEDLAPVALDFNEGDVAPLNQTIKIFDHYMGNADFEIDSLENATSMMGDRHHWYPSDMTTTMMSQDFGLQSKKKKIFVYEFSHKSESHSSPIFDFGLGNQYIKHGDELAYLFGNPKEGTPLAPPLSEEDDLEMSRKMVQMWTNFARTGHPCPEDDPAGWLQYTSDNPGVFVIDKIMKMQEGDPKKEVREFWRQLPLKTNLLLFPESVTNLKTEDMKTEKYESKTAKEKNSSILKPEEISKKTDGRESLDVSSSEAISLGEEHNSDLDETKESSPSKDAAASLADENSSNPEETRKDEL